MFNVEMMLCTMINNEGTRQKGCVKTWRDCGNEDMKSFACPMRMFTINGYNWITMFTWKMAIKTVCVLCCVTL